MVNYQCFRCGLETISKTKFLRHLKRKYICKSVCTDISVEEIFEFYFKNIKNDENDDVIKKSGKCNQNVIINEERNHSAKIEDENKKYICEYCNRHYTRRQNMWRHKKTCKLQNDIINDEEYALDINARTIIEAKVKELEELKKREIQKLKEIFMDQLDIALKKKEQETYKLMAMSGTASQNNTNCIVNHNNDNRKLELVLNLNSYKNTDHSHLTDQDYLECIRKGNMGIPYLIEKIHFNPSKPENHNIFINNIKSDYIKMYDDGRWKTALQYETVNMMVQDKANLVEDKIEEWYDNNHIYSRDNYKEILNKFPRFLNRLTDSKYVGRKVEQESKLILFNKKDLVLDYQKRMKEEKKTVLQKEQNKTDQKLIKKNNKISETIKNEVLQTIIKQV